MQQRRTLYTGLIAVTLVLGVMIGTVVSERVIATQDGPELLVIPEPVQLSNGFSAIADELGPTVVNIEVEGPADTARSDRLPDLFDFFGGAPFGRAPDVPEGSIPNRRSTGSGFIVDEDGYFSEI